MKVYHVCGRYHENCCDEPLFATMAAALAFIGGTSANLSRSSFLGQWNTDIRDARQDMEGYKGREMYTIYENEVRE